MMLPLLTISRVPQDPITGAMASTWAGYFGFLILAAVAGIWIARRRRTMEMD